jgi:hypothetical protein
VSATMQCMVHHNLKSLFLYWLYLSRYTSWLTFEDVYQARCAALPRRLLPLH